VLGEPGQEQRSEVVFVDGCPVLRRQRAGSVAVEPWEQQPAALMLLPPGEPGEDRLELKFAINSDGELMVEGRDLLSDRAMPQRALGRVR